MIAGLILHETCSEEGEVSGQTRLLVQEMGDETVEQNPQLRLQAMLFRLGCSDTLVADKANLKSEIESVVAAHGALPAQNAAAPLR